jgi:hypothetical protein
MKHYFVKFVTQMKQTRTNLVNKIALMKVKDLDGFANKMQRRETIRDTYFNL